MLVRLGQESDLMIAIAARLPAHGHSVADPPRRAIRRTGDRGMGHAIPSLTPRPGIRRAGVAVRVIVHSRVDASAGG